MPGGTMVVAGAATWRPVAETTTTKPPTGGRTTAGHPPYYRPLLSLLMFATAAVAAAAATAKPPEATSAHGQRRGVRLCSEVHSRCFARDGCKLALESYFLHCLDLSESAAAPSRCTDRCRTALIMLLSSAEHDGPAAFRDCDCRGEPFCLEQKRRIAVCQDEVQIWLAAVDDPRTAISCSLAALVCSADSSCLMAIGYYEDHCRRLRDAANPRCTARCNNSLAILYRQDKASKLRDCYCDGTESYDCAALKRNTRQLCFGGGSGATSPRIRHPAEHDHTRRTDTRWRATTTTTTPAVDVGHGNDVDDEDDDEFDTSVVDNSIERDFLALGSSSLHNSAYTIHSGACAARWLGYRRSIHVTMTIVVTIWLLTNR